MFNPFNLLAGITFVYLLLPTLGFGLFPEYFEFSSNFENFIILFCFISIMLATAWLGKKIEAATNHQQRVISNRTLQGKWMLLGEERRAFGFVALATILSLASLLTAVAYSGMLGGDFTPHEFRMGVASSGDLGLVIAYNTASLLILVSFNLTIISLIKSNKMMKFLIIGLILFSLIIATGQRSMIVLALCSYLLAKAKIKNEKTSVKTVLVLAIGVGLVLVLGMARQGGEFNYVAFIWQASVRFDLFYPQFFNFLDVYRGLNDIGYGYYHFTYPLQLIPSSLMQSKPVTFLHFINRDLMNIADETGNDFTAFSEFIYNYGVALGLLFYSMYCFIASFVVQRIYRRAGENPIFFVIYFPGFLVYLSLVLLTGLSNQAHIFSIAGIFVTILPSKLFMQYVKPKRSAV